MADSIMYFIPLVSLDDTDGLSRFAPLLNQTKQRLLHIAERERANDGVDQPHPHQYDTALSHARTPEFCLKR